MTTTLSSTASAVTGTISSPGVGSGMDINGIVTQLVALEKQPLKGLQTQAATINAQVSAYGGLQSQIATLGDAAKALSDANTWKAASATSANPSALTATASGTPVAGVYSVLVRQLASAQSIASPSFASAATTVGAGTLSIRLGSWSGNAFTPGAAAAVDVTVGAGDSLSTVAGKINAANAGVSASVVTDANGSRLVMQPTQTGAASGFQVQANDADGNNSDATGLSALAYDPAGGTSATVLTQAAANARAEVNGLSVESASNALNGMVPGLNLQLLQTTTSPVAVSVAPDNTAMTGAVQKFIDAYNSVNTLLAADLKYDASSKTGGPLQGDRSAVALQTSLRSMLGGNSGSSSVLTRLSDLGIQFQRDGSLKADSTKLTAAVGNLAETAKFFTGTVGFGARMSQLTTGMLSVNGTLTLRQAALKSSLKSNSNEQDKVNNHADEVQARLLKQYNAMDANVAKLNALNAYVTQQVTGWNNQKNNY